MEELSVDTMAGKNTYVELSPSAEAAVVLSTAVELETAVTVGGVGTRATLVAPVTASDAYVATDSRVALLDFSHLSLGGTQPAELGIQPRERRHERSLLDATTPAHAGVDVR